MNVENAYDKWVESYDAMLNKTRDLDLVATNENLGCMKFQSVLEVGCGTGKNTNGLHVDVPGWLPSTSLRGCWRLPNKRLRTSTSNGIDLTFQNPGQPVARTST